MKERMRFRAQVEEVLRQIDPEVLAYDPREFWMIQSPYEYLEFYAMENGLMNMAIALPLARGLHNGTHRKASVQRDGMSYRLPYVIHCLLVCRILADIKPLLPKEEEDIMLAAALCHDMVEDIPFPEHGMELVNKYFLDPRVLETVRLVSKRRDFTPEEEREFFHHIEENPLSLLVKLSDRSQNVEDMYNMSVWKVHEYIGETAKFFLPMCSYGMVHYPHLQKTIEVLRDKILCLTRASQVLVDRCEEREQELKAQLESLRQENQQLRERYYALWNDGKEMQTWN